MESESESESLESEDDDSSDEEKPLAALLDKTKAKLPSPTLGSGGFLESFGNFDSLKTGGEDEDDTPLGLRASRIGLTSPVHPLSASAGGTRDEEDDDRPLALHPDQVRRSQYIAASAQQQQQQMMMMQAQAAAAAQMQMQQNTSAMGMGMGMNTFNPLPPPPGLTGPRTGTTPPPLMQQQPAYAPYESPYAAYQQPAYMATTYGGYPQQQYQPQMSAMPPPPQDNSQMYGYTSRSSDGSHSSTDRGPPSVFGHKTSNSGGSRSGTGAASGEQQRNDMRASASSDAYADYAFATGPGQSGAQPRNLTIANA